MATKTINLDKDTMKLALRRKRLLEAGDRENWSFSRVMRWFIRAAEEKKELTKQSTAC